MSLMPCSPAARISVKMAAHCFARLEVAMFSIAARAEVSRALTCGLGATQLERGLNGYVCVKLSAS